MSKVPVRLAVGLGYVCACFALSVPLAAAETPEAILAAHIRDQGYPCKKAENAVRDQKQSSPNMTVWTLTCEHVAYRLTLIPDMAAKVEKLDK